MGILIDTVRVLIPPGGTFELFRSIQPSLLKKLKKSKKLFLANRKTDKKLIASREKIEELIEQYKEQIK